MNSCQLIEYTLAPVWLINLALFIWIKRDILTHIETKIIIWPMATAQDKKALSYFFKSLIGQIIREQDERDIIAFGNSAKSLRFKIDERGGALYGEDYFEQQEQGLPPINKAPNRLRERYVNLPQKIYAWLQVKRNIPDHLKTLDNADRIASNIKKYGTRTFSDRQYGLPLSEIVAIQVEKFKKRLSDDKIGEIQSTIIEAYK